MFLNQNQIQELLQVIDRTTNIFIAKNVGSQYLTQEEILNLKSIGINTTTLYDPSLDVFKQNFYFGLISDSLKLDANKLDFLDLKDHLLHGRYIPLTQVEELNLESIKNQFLGDIRAKKGKIFQDVNNLVAQKSKSKRVEYENIIRSEVEKGFVDQKTVSEIARELGKKTGDWSRDFQRMVEYISHYAFNEGRVAAIERKDPKKKIYFDVYDGACKVCIKLYLTGQIGSEPKLFTIDQLKKNGSNIGRKSKDWLATLSPTHPYCRCTANEYQEGYVWNDKTRRFELEKVVKIKDRQPIRFVVKIKGEEKEYFV